MNEQTAYERVYLDGKQAERERIINLLEVLAEVTGYVEIEFNQLITLIKGEQK